MSKRESHCPLLVINTILVTSYGKTTIFSFLSTGTANQGRTNFSFSLVTTAGNIVAGNFGKGYNLVIW